MFLAFKKQACSHTKKYGCLVVGTQAHRRSSFQLLSARARRQRINKALQCIGVTNLAVFHNKVVQSSYQLETIKRAIHHSYKAASVQGAALTERLIKCNQNHNQLKRLSETVSRSHASESLGCRTPRLSHTHKATGAVSVHRKWPQGATHRRGTSQHAGENTQKQVRLLFVCVLMTDITVSFFPGKPRLPIRASGLSLCYW